MKKLLVLFIVLSMVVTLAGCSKDSGVLVNSGNNQGGEQETAGQETNEEGTNDEGSNEEVVVEEALEHVTLKLTFPGSTQKDEELVEEKMNEYLKDKINASIDIDPIPWSSYKEKTNLMMATGEHLDLVFTASWYDYYSNVSKKAFLPMNDLIDQYAPKTKELLHPALFNGPKVDGEMYAMPTNKEIATAESIMFRKDLIDKYGFELPDFLSPQDFDQVLTPMLETIKANEEGIYPMFISNNSIVRNYEDELLGVSNMLQGMYNAETGEMEYFQEREETKELYDLMLKWNKAGYINEDSLTAENYVENMFSCWQPYKPGKDGEMSAQLGAEFVIVPTTKGIVDTGSVTGSMLAISRTTVDGERAMMLLELLNTDKYLNNLLNFGVEGVHFVKIDDNTIDFPEGITSENATYNPSAQWMFQNQFLNYLRKGENPDKWKLLEEFNNSAVVSPLLGFTFDSTAVKAEVAACSNVSGEYNKALQDGLLDWREVLPEYMDKMKANGAEAILAEKQKQVDAFLAGQ